MRPHQVRYWLNNNRQEEEPEVFDAEVRRVCEHYYAEAFALHEKGVHLVSTDEKTSIQALEHRGENNPSV